MPESAPPVRPKGEYSVGAPKSHSQATVALVLGTIGVFIFGIVLGPIAIFMGLRARREIDDSNGRLTGRGRASAAIVAGVAAVVVWAIILVVSTTA